MTELEPPEDIKEAFKKYAEGGNHMNAEQLRQFLLDFQGESDPNLSDAEAILHQIIQKRHHITKFTRHSLTLDDFYYFLFSVDLNPPIHSKVSPHPSFDFVGNWNYPCYCFYFLILVGRFPVCFFLSLMGAV